MGSRRPDTLAAISSWVGTQLQYLPGSSGPTDGAVDTLLAAKGVCRDYAHLAIERFASSPPALPGRGAANGSVVAVRAWTGNDLESLAQIGDWAL